MPHIATSLNERAATRALFLLRRGDVDGDLIAEVTALLIGEDAECAVDRMCSALAEHIIIFEQHEHFVELLLAFIPFWPGRLRSQQCHSARERRHAH